MTFQELFTLLNEYQPIVLLIIVLAPWLALGICLAVPGQREEPFVLSFNLGMAVISLLMAIGYLLYATHTGGWTRVVEEANILLMLAPCYYVSVSLWVTKQRLPLGQIPVFRAIQGLALIGAGYLGIAWFLSKIRILALTFIPFQVLVLLLLGLAGIVYLGYLRLTGSDVESSKAKSPGPSPSRGPKPYQGDRSIDDELDALRREMENENR